MAERLRAAGFPRAFAVIGGLGGCAEAGLPVISKPISKPASMPVPKSG